MGTAEKEMTLAMVTAREVGVQDARMALKAAMIAGDMAVANYLQEKFFAAPHEIVVAVS